MSLKQRTALKSLEETFHYQETWLRDLFHNGKSAIDSMFIADVLGGGWNSPWEIWASLRQFTPSLALREQWENRLQWTSILKNFYEGKTKQSIDLDWRRISHPTHKWATASILGLINKEEEPVGGVLFVMSKEPDDWCADGTDIKSWRRILPPSVAMEAYWMMFCTQLPWIEIVVGLPSQEQYLETRIIRIHNDPRMQENLFQAAKAWRENHLHNNRPPVIDGSRSCTSYLMDRFAFGSDELREATKKEENILLQYEDVNQKLRELQAQKQLLQNELFRQIGHFGGLQCKDGQAALLLRNRNGLALKFKKAS